VNAYTNFTACLHGLDAGKITLRRDELHNALWVYLSKDVSIRVDLNPEAFGQDRTDERGRDVEGLLRLAEVAAQAAEEITQHQGGK
jgi:hypothetical protein